jgi:hypothetical protein
VRLAAVVVALSVLAMATNGCGQGATAAITTTTLSESGVTRELQADLTIPDSICLGCHADFPVLIAQEDPKTFSHQFHLAERIACIVCHPGAGHNGVMPAPDGAICAGCHGISMPHPVTFIGSHGRVVQQQGTAVCARCHETNLYCRQCHGISMPHPEDWVATHGPLATAEPDVCARCHTSKTCARCHGDGVPHPAGWVQSHGQVALSAGGAQACTTCHEPAYCTTCHGTPMPHVSDWGKTHAAAAGQNQEACLLCHQKADCDACHALHATHVSGGGS